jgi:hypothetical protein
MSLSYIGSAKCTSSGVLNITGISALAGDLLIIFVSADNNGGSTDVTINGTVTTPLNFTGYLWTLGGSNSTYNTFAFAVPLASGFPTTYTISGSPTPTTGWEVCGVVVRSSLGTLSTDFASVANNASNTSVNITNPGGTTTLPNDFMIWYSQGQNPTTNEGPASYTNRIYAFSTVSGFGVDCLCTAIQATAGSTGTITAASTNPVNNWNSIVVAIKEASNTPSQNAIFANNNF